MPFETPRNPHRRRAAVAVLASLAVAFLAAPAAAAPKSHEGTVRGTVTAMASGEPVAGAEITVTGPAGETETTTTDRKGKFKLDVPAGDYVIRMTAEGLAPFEAKLAVQPKASQVVTVEMLDAATGRRSQAADHYNAGVAAYQAGDRAAAKESLRAAAETDPTLAEPLQMLARIHHEESDWAAAAAAADAALAIAPADEQSQRLAYEAYRRIDQAKAVEMRGKLADDPELAKQLAVHAFNEGAVANQEGDATTAAARFREASRLDPGLAAAHFALATVDYQADRFDEALAGARRGLESEPDSVQGRRLVFISLDAAGDAEAAAAALDAYAEVDAEGAVDILYRRGEAGFLNGEFEPAKKALAQLLEVEPENAHAHRLMGLMSASTDVEEAKRYLTRFLELAPDDPEAATVREILGEL